MALLRRDHARILPIPAQVKGHTWKEFGVKDQQSCAKNHSFSLVKERERPQIACPSIALFWYGASHGYKAIADRHMYCVTEMQEEENSPFFLKKMDIFTAYRANHAI